MPRERRQTTQVQSPETLRALTFLQKRRRGIGDIDQRLKFRRPTAANLLTGTLGTSSSTLITRATLG